MTELDIRPCTAEEVALVEAGFTPDEAAFYDLLREAKDDPAQQKEILDYGIEIGLLDVLVA